MARKCKEDAEKTRQAVLESALDVFSEKGYAKATFDEIAARAGFTKGAVYWYFRNKADLVAALIIEYVGRKREELMPNVPEGNTLENLLEYFVLWADAGVDRALALTKNFHLEKVNQVLVELKAKNELRDDLDINMIQHIIVATYMGIVFSTLSKRADYNVADMVRAGLGLLFESIKRK